MGYIYKITNTINNKCYIGQTIQDDPYWRWDSHRCDIKAGRGCPLLRRAVNKYGVDNFKFEVLIICFDDDIYKYEKNYIKKCNSLTPSGYNASEGGEPGGNFKGKTHTEEVRNILREKATAWNNNPENKIRLGQLIRIGLLNSEKWKKAKEEGRIGTHGNHRTSQTDSTKNKISESLKEYYKSHPEINMVRNKIGRKGRRVSQYDLNNILIETYNSIKEAAEKSGVDKRNIQSNASKRSKTAGGYIWEYAD
jgi:group I intron endonuclease